MKLVITTLLAGIFHPYAHAFQPTPLVAGTPDDTCLAQAEALCNADGACAAFGLYGNQIQLHGCQSLVANPDWTIYFHDVTNNTFVRQPGTSNINENECTTHPNTGMEHECSAPPPAPSLYTKIGSIDVGTYENTVFYMRGVLYILENIACSYVDHAGIWQPAVFGNHSYARIRELKTGEVIVNISGTVTYGFVTPFYDQDFDTLWLFGTQADRCGGNGNAMNVWTWYSTDPTLQDSSWSNATMAFNLGSHTYNTQVTKIAPLPGSSIEEVTAWEAKQSERQEKLFKGGKLPSSSSSFSSSSSSPVTSTAKYAMILECFNFAVNMNTDGNLTYGWSLLKNTTNPPGGSCGGPCMYYNGVDDFFYILTGGNTVKLFRTQDFQNWTESSPSPFISPSAEDALIAPYADFPARSSIRGSPPNQFVGIPEPFPFLPYNPYWMGANWTAWSRNSNDADICCFHAEVNTSSFVIWGASTQGQKPADPPLDGSDAGTNSMGVANMSLPALLSLYFP